MGKISIFELLLPFLLTSVVCLESKIEITVFLPGKKLDWTNARLYCQSNYVDLITWDIVGTDQLSTWLKGQSSFFWIGLHRDNETASVWKWINVKTGEGLSGDYVSQDSNWGDLKLTGDCGSFQPTTGKWNSKTCSAEFKFICYDDNLVVVTENKTWEDALNHCREMTTSSYQYDLLSVTSPLDYSYVRDKIYRATTDEVWTGLRFLAGEWWWMDGEEVDHNSSLPDCPTLWQHCGVFSKSGSNWITRDCSEKRNFICHRTKVQT
ncbi:uncharacterized protein LOC121642055 [Melanotaenia boesemani]|uniref:uncharacterized protein LOC121642055 n=1 Tax=Melanotaenia boesemani TaxID=1250792 RepID=UPI001C03A727|nr:uncharacterized protein LOC121642055 [Melanotaenia boesemani]